MWYNLFKSFVTYRIEEILVCVLFRIELGYLCLLYYEVGHRCKLQKLVGKLFPSIVETTENICNEENQSNEYIAFSSFYKNTINQGFNQRIHERLLLDPVEI